MNEAMNEIEINVQLEQKCLETIKKLSETKTLIDYEFIPCNKLKYTHKSVYQYAGHVSLATLIVFSIILIIYKAVEMPTAVAWTLLIINLFVLIVCIISFVIYRLKPRAFKTTELTYKENENVKLYELIPTKEIALEEVKPYLKKAVEKYIQNRVKSVISQYMDKVIIEEEHDIKKEYMLTMKTISDDEDED